MTIERHPITDHASWLKMRATDLTASDLGAAIGIDRFKSPLQLWAEKTMALPGPVDNKAMRRGRWLESAVLAAIRDQYGWDNVEQARDYLRDSELRLGATPDALRLHPHGPPTNIQCKVVNKPAYERDWASGPPLGYTLQTLCEGMLLDAKESVIAALVIDTYGADLYLHPVPRHQAAEARVRAIAAKFWEDIAAGKRPPVDYARDDATLSTIYPQSQAEPALDLTGDNRLAELLPARALCVEERDDLIKSIAAIDTEIKSKLGEHEHATLPGWKLSWKTQTRPEHTVAASTFRRLSVTATEIEQEDAA